MFYKMNHNKSWLGHRVPELGWGVVWSLLPQKLFPVDNLLPTKDCFSPMESPWIYKPPLRTESRPAVGGQHKTSLTGVFRLFFLNLTRLLLVHYGFQFAFWGVLFVCVEGWMGDSCAFPLFFFQVWLWVFFLFVYFIKKEKEGVELDGWGGWEDLGEVGEGKPWSEFIVQSLNEKLPLLSN